MPRILALLLLLVAPAPALALDVELYGRLLEKHTREVKDIAGTRVDYAALGSDVDWRRLVESLAASRPETLRSRDEKLAFWINAYNILAIDLVARSYPVGSIRDIGSLLRPVWKREAGRIGGQPRTLDEIEHRILRPLGEPRVHGAIVCASLSCPPLARSPFSTEALDTQLDDILRRWLADPRKGVRADPERNTLYLSRIFKWFAEDFEASGGVLEFIVPYVPEPTRRFLQETGDAARIRYLDYDWSLNDLARAGNA